MTDFLSRMTRVCARIVAMVDLVARSPRGGFASSAKASKSSQIGDKGRSEEKPRRLPRRPSISRQSTAVESDSFPAVPGDAKHLFPEFDVASFCSELEAIRATMVPLLKASESRENAARTDNPPADAVATSSSLIPSHNLEYALASLEDDVANAVRLLESDRMFLRSSNSVSANC